MTSVYMHPVLAACLTKAEQRIGNTSWQAINVTTENWKTPPNLGTKDDSAKSEVW